MDWLNFFQGPLYVLHYEKLENNTRQELEAVLSFLNVKINPHKVSCALKKKEGTFKRKRKSIQEINQEVGFELYPPKTSKIIQQYQRAVQIALDIRAAH